MKTNQPKNKVQVPQASFVPMNPVKNWIPQKESAPTLPKGINPVGQIQIPFHSVNLKK